MRRGASFLTIACLVSGCAGYSFQGTTNPLLDKEGIHRVYIAPVQNDTYKPGVENLVYNELNKTIAAHRRVKLVTRAEDADAVLKVDITTAGYAPGATTFANQLYPQGAGSQNMVVATTYVGVLGCTFTLERRLPPGIPPSAQAKAKVWSAGFSRSKTFPGNNQLGIYGTTSALINESEFDRALRDMAQSMMEDVHESMLAMF